MPPPSSRPWALITPASRGIGRALARHVLSTTRVPVVATARGDQGNIDAARKEILAGVERRDEVKAEERLKVVGMDFLDEDSIATAAATCKTHFPPRDHWHLHLAFCVPGLLFPEKAPSQIDAADALLTFRTNALGPLLAIKHFSPFLPRKSTRFPSSDGDDTSSYDGLPSDHAVWATMSARVGSIGDNRLGGWYSYRASKAAVNQATKTFDNHLRTSAAGNAMAVALHPGTVKTGLSEEFWGNVAEGKLFSPEFASERLVEVVRGLGVERGRGRCWDWRGEEVLP
ncbi:Short-chain dehydrogenase reductase [Lasiodiplodia theobromae]|uniref:C-factor n=1 Tax=Lasiodiplodia theobromae TaxID=45133 RepID=A0A5N5CYT9_9PEZI|nr:Short-chain dehydrogenase reductase [Lasiodiplodia theobromae]KAB2570535.1 C-factor [Lasiodiplodia theobromae]KAF4537519.1 Short-chain dehydrogenase reductase [Lasiodiplodia theobromae]